MILSYEAAPSVFTDLTVVNPELGNKYKFLGVAVIQRLIDGTFYSVVKDEYYEIEFQFKMPNAQVADLITFLIELENRPLFINGVSTNLVDPNQTITGLERAFVDCEEDVRENFNVSLTVNSTTRIVI